MPETTTPAQPSREWIIRIPRHPTTLLLKIAISILMMFFLFRGCQSALVCANVQIREESLAPFQGITGINFSIRNISGACWATTTEQYRVVRFRHGNQTDVKVIFRGYADYKWLSATHLRICQIGANSDARGDKFIETWHELKISYRLGIAVESDKKYLEKACYT